MSEEPSPRIALLSNNDFAIDIPDGSPADLTARADVEKVAKEVETALTARGAIVLRLCIAGFDLEAVMAELRAFEPTLVFNLCESLSCQSRNEIVVPGLLDLWGVAYTGSGPLALGLALDKPTAKRLLAGSGVITPAGITVSTPAEIDPLTAKIDGYPVFCKLSREDASVGITHESVCHDLGQVRKRVASMMAEFSQPVLVERFIEGREIYVSVIGDLEPRVLGRHEIDFSHMPDGRPRIVSYEGKWVPSSPDYKGTQPGPCQPLPPDVLERLDRAAIDSFKALGLRDYGRIDVRLANDGTPYVIDVNPNCDLSVGAGYARAASFAGVAYEELIWRICNHAFARAERTRVPHAEPKAARRRNGAQKRKAGGSSLPQSSSRRGRAVSAGGDRVRA
jgi:D-alanine-D-alanine ligase